MRLAWCALLALAACAHPAAPTEKVPARVSSVAPKAENARVLGADASAISYARIAQYPEPGWNVPRSPQHAPDGKVTYLASEHGDETMALFAFDPKTGKSDVLLRASDLGASASGERSREEELRRERQRDRNEGITSYVWAKKANVLVTSQNGDVYLRDENGKIRRLTDTKETEIDPKPCETGERVAYVRGTELFSYDIAKGREVQLTQPAKNATHGQSDYVAQEELQEPSGYFWSPKCDRIAYLEVDDSAVEKVPVLGYRKDAPDLMMERYPRAGAANPRVRAGIVDVATKQTTWITLPTAQEQYLGRFTWAPDGKTLYVQSMPRDQKKVSLLHVDPTTGKAVELWNDTSKAWVSFSPFKVIEGVHRKALLWTSIKTGHRHIEVRIDDGASSHDLTSGDWDVDSIVAYDDANVFFTGTKDGPLERHLYAVAWAGGAVTKLTKEHGVHSIKADEHGKTWIDVHSGIDRAPRAVVVSEGQVRGDLTLPHDPDIEKLGLRIPELVDVGDLHGVMLKPRHLEGNHPAIVMVYGGPESQLVFDTWQPHLLWQHLADRGFVVFQLDNRGTGGRGRAFAQSVHKQLGKLELEDQIAGAKWLAAQPFVDGSRIGIYGHSYGGFMAALAMLDGKGVFKVGVAGSPVIDWRLYDTGYTERYMETPQTNAEGYAASDLAKKAAGLTGKLFLTHAMMDENVHYAHTARLVDALIAANKTFDLLVLPGERHGVRVPGTRAYMQQRIADYFADNL